ncbi:MAG: DUF3757 domain-containing protein [Gammaproteobacteria bacterium]
MRIVSVILLCVMAASAVATPINCPAPHDITRIDGEYAWRSNDSLFEGYFAVPQFGRGQSSEVTQFLEARWIQLTDLAKAKGFVECDYAGNVEGEIIRFSLLNAQAGPKPSAHTWSCSFHPPFPSSQCTCAGDPGICTFEKT